MKRMLVFGCGYSGKAVATRLLREGWAVSGTTRSSEGATALEALGISPILFDGVATPELVSAIETATHVLISVAPDLNGDRVLAAFKDEIEQGEFEWIGYLSTIGVYGDAGGAWIDETAERAASSERNRWRIRAEDQWLSFAEKMSVQIFRLAGIYGPGRNPMRRLKEGKARAIVKPGQVFNRIHVDDIANAVMASIKRPAKIGSAGIYNVTDDLPAPPQEVLAYAAKISGLPPVPEIPFDEADLSDMARSFYSDCKRVSNGRIKSELGMSFEFPEYRSAFDALLRAGELS